jgi:hypothetical protein
MKGGHGDAYYYQLVANIRRYKGARPIPPIVPKPITIDGHFDDWRAVSPDFRDDIGDPVHRDHRGWGKDSRYTNSTGRNDLAAAKVSFDAENFYFYVETRGPISRSTDPNWMLLFVDADHDAKTGWLGYDVVINRSNVRPQTTTLERTVAGKYEWNQPIDITYRMAGNQLELAIPHAALGLKTLPATFDYKWADNIQQTGDASDFTLNGDAAPNDRFNYRAKIEDRR